MEKVESLAESRRTPVCKVAAMLIRSGGMDPSEAEATMMPWANGDPTLENHIEKAVEYLDGYASPAGGDGGSDPSPGPILVDEETMFHMAQNGMLFQEVEPARARRLLRELDVPVSWRQPHPTPSVRPPT